MASKAQRIRDRYFAEVPQFNTTNGMYSPIPWIYRNLLSVLQVRTWQILTLLLMRSGPESLSWLVDAQIANDVGIGRRKVAPHLRELEKLGFITSQVIDGLRYVCIVDPMVVVRKLLEENPTTNFLPPKVVAAIEDDLDVMLTRKKAKVAKAADEKPEEAAATG